MRVARLLLKTTALTNFHRLYEILWPRPAFFPNEGKTYRRTFMSPNVDKVCIVYGKQSGQVRQHVYSETDHREYHPKVRNLQHNEAMCFVPIAFHHAGHRAFDWAIRRAVLEHGHIRAVLYPWEPGSRMFAQMAGGVVTSVVMADPHIPGDARILARDRWVEIFDPTAVGGPLDLKVAA